MLLRGEIQKNRTAKFGYKESKHELVGQRKDSNLNFINVQIAKKIETLRVKEKSSKSARNGRKDRYGMKIQLTLE